MVIPQATWARDFRIGLVLYASSASPIIKPSPVEPSKPNVPISLNKLLSSKKIEKNVDDSKNEMYKVIIVLSKMLNRTMPTKKDEYIMNKYLDSSTAIKIEK